VTEEKLIIESISEGEKKIANMTKVAKTIEEEATGAEQQAVDYIAAQKKVDEEKIKKMATIEVSEQKKLARLEKQLEEITEKTAVIKTA
jgi:hypothetical protein